MSDNQIMSTVNVWSDRDKTTFIRSFEIKRTFFVPPKLIIGDDEYYPRFSPDAVVGSIDVELVLPSQVMQL